MREHWTNWWITCKIEDVVQTKGEQAKREGGSAERGGEIKGNRPQIRYRRVGVMGAITTSQCSFRHSPTLHLYILYLSSLSQYLYEWTLWPFSVALFHPNEELINIPLMLYRKGEILLFLYNGALETHL